MQTWLETLRPEDASNLQVILILNQVAQQPHTILPI